MRLWISGRRDKWGAEKSFTVQQIGARNLRAGVNASELMDTGRRVRIDPNRRRCGEEKAQGQ
jgi:hypothetical protein